MLAYLRFAESTGEANNPILPEPSEMFWGALSFAALFFLVKYVLLPPITSVMEERASKVRGDLDAAEIARSRAGSAATEVQDQLAGVRAEAAAVVDAARTEAEAARAAVMAEAEVEAAAIRDAGATEIAAARDVALSGITPQVSELAADAASRVMNRQIGWVDAQPVVDRFLQNPN